MQFLVAAVAVVAVVIVVTYWIISDTAGQLFYNHAIARHCWGHRLIGGVGSEGAGESPSVVGDNRYDYCLYGRWAKLTSYTYYLSMIIVSF